MTCFCLQHIETGISRYSSRMSLSFQVVILVFYVYSSSFSSWDISILFSFFFYCSTSVACWVHHLHAFNFPDIFLYLVPSLDIHFSTISLWSLSIISDKCEFTSWHGFILVRNPACFSLSEARMEEGPASNSQNRIGLLLLNPRGDFTPVT